MGKKNKHSKDKLYQTVQELKSHHMGENREFELSILHRRLKFDSCCLTLSTITGKPMGLCDDDGYCYVFECDLIVKFLEKFSIHPITGKKVNPKDLIELKFYKNDQDQYHCPIIYKLFNAYSKIVANRKNGNVYSYEAYQQLNLRPRNLKDLLTDEPFDKSDIVTIQDPDLAVSKWNVNEFHYFKNKLKIDDDDGSSNIRDANRSEILKASMEEYKQNEGNIISTYSKFTEPSSLGDKSTALDSVNSAAYSDGSLARSVTSTVAPVASEQKPAILSQEQILYPRIKRKGYIQMVTNLGPINLELFCDRTPKTCHNFLLLAARGYYDKTCFHRLVKNFIVQGGDPTGTGTGGQSAWGEPFRDECHNDLKHAGRGVLAMANSGPDTNKSQFYITLDGTWDHLDGKHTVFGRVVGGEDTLDKIGAIEADKQQKPIEKIEIQNIIRYVDPFEEAEATIAAERKQASKEKTDEKVSPQPLKKFRSGIGIYINLDAARSSSRSTRTSAKGENGQADSLEGKLAAVGSKKKNGSRIYENFSSW